MTNDGTLAGYVSAWRSSVDDVVALLRELRDEDWTKPADPELEHAKPPMASYTAQGPIARASWTPTQIIDKLERAAAAWSWQTLLSNRVVDMWMHEQDVRRAVDRPGNLDTAGAAHTVQVFARSLGYSVGKRVAPPPGTTVVLDALDTSLPVHVALEVDGNRRAVVVRGDHDLGQRILVAMAVTP